MFVVPKELYKTFKVVDGKLCSITELLREWYEPGVETVGLYPLFMWTKREEAIRSVLAYPNAEVWRVQCTGVRQCPIKIIDGSLLGATRLGPSHRCGRREMVRQFWAKELSARNTRLHLMWSLPDTAICNSVVPVARIAWSNGRGF